jgi:hypothetical protein
MNTTHTPDQQTEINQIKTQRDELLAALELYMKREKNGWMINLAWREDTHTIMQTAIDKARDHKKPHTFDVIFHDENHSNAKGFAATEEYCIDYITRHNGTNESYFADYKGGTVQVVCNETGVERSSYTVI